MSRVWAVLNRQRESAQLHKLNLERIHRLMSQNGLLPSHHTGKPPGRAQGFQIVTIRPNLRWTSDGFSIASCNSQSVRVGFWSAPHFDQTVLS